MKKTLFVLMSVLLLCGACSDNEDEIRIYKVAVKLTAQTEVAEGKLAGVKVSLKSLDGVVRTAETGEDGRTSFEVPAGIYETSASFRYSADGYAYVFNGLKANIVVSEDWVENTAVELEMVSSRAGQLVIKELYTGGCMDNTGKKVFQGDKYVILYNNSDQVAAVENLAMGIAPPYLSFSKNNYYGEDGKLLYEHEGIIPALASIVYFQGTLTLQPYSQVLVAINGAIDHTVTYTNSVNLANADYCVYEPTIFNHPIFHPAPSASIPSSNYLKGVLYGLGNATLASYNPAFFIFSVKGDTPAAYASNEANLWDKTGGKGTASSSLKVPVEWILDAVDMYSGTNLDNCTKRLTPAVDAGYTLLTHRHGHTSYRNVDKDATEAIAENAGKLVYGYDKGMDGATDPSGIDAEASMKKGARIVYKDTNNSTYDFHERKQASLKD